MSKTKRHGTTHILGLIALLWVFSASAQAQFFSYAVGQSTGRSNAEFDQKKKEMETYTIRCQPQDNSKTIWTCTDPYSNTFNNLKIILEKPKK